MKKLILIGGPMGIGKTTVSEKLFKRLENAVFLDGDWCWNMHPFVVNEENKKMVLGNIHHLLNAYLANSNFEYIVFCWVMDEQQIIDDVLEKLVLQDTDVYSFSLIASEEKLTANILKDVAMGIREEAAVAAALPRLKKFSHVNTIKIDVTDKNPIEVTNEILSKIP